MKQDIGFLITSYTGGEKSDLKRRMVKVLCRNMQQQGHYVCLASHSIVDEETQGYCNCVIYDSDNSFKYKGMPVNNDNHAVAEVKLIHQAIAQFKFMGFKDFFKVCFDNNPIADYHQVIKKCRDTGKQFVGTDWGNSTSIGTMIFYSHIDFYERAFPLEEMHKMNQLMESVAYNSFASKGLLGNSQIMSNRSGTFFGFDPECWSVAGGKAVKDYPYI